MDTPPFECTRASVASYPIPAFHSNDLPESQVTTSADIKALIGEQHYDYFLTLEENVINAIRAGFFPTDRHIVLRGLQFSLSDNLILVMPENVELHYCEVSRGTVHFYQGQLDAIAPGAVVVGCGNKTIANANAPYSQSDANVHGAIANANEPDSQANANASGSVANANVGKSFAFGNEKNARITQNDPAATVQSTVGEVFVVPYSRSKNTLKEQADQGDKEAAFQFGMLKIYAPQVSPEDLKIGLDYLEKAADTHSGAAYERGKLSLQGEKVAYSEALFVHYWSLAHGLNHPKAAFELGMQYLHGSKVTQSNSTALLYLTWAYNAHHHPDAAFQCGELHLRPLFHKNPEEAYRWHLIAAQDGHQQAQERVNTYQKQHLSNVLPPGQHYATDGEKLYQKGMAILCKVNLSDTVISLAKVYLEIAADYPYPKASFELGMLYFKGDKLPYNEVESLHYLTRAYEHFQEYEHFQKEEQPHREAAFQLGELHQHIAELRKVVTPDLKHQWETLIKSKSEWLSISSEDADVKAQEWYQIAAQQRHPKAQKKVASCAQVNAKI